MQPVQIGMNSALVLIALLLAVPLQLFLTHYINSKYETTPTDDPLLADKNNIQSARVEAFHRLSDGLFGLVDYVQGTFHHYSKWTNLKELFVVPYKKGPQKLNKYGPQGKTTVKVNVGGKSGNAKVTVTQNKAGTSNTASDSKLATGSKSSTGSKAESKDDYFARSESPRVSRPPHVKFKVGQVVKHRQEGYFGVIIGWDETAKAPQNWLNKYYSDREDAVSYPHYLVLVDARYSASIVPFHYLPQDDLLIVEANIKVQAPEIGKYFEGFENHRHVPRPWLQEMYPEDSN